MQCPKCKEEIPEEYKYCPWCGKKQGPGTARKTMKRANGTGTVYKLSGRRRKPWVACMSKADGGKLTDIIFGYYETKTAALEALSEHVKKPVSERYNMTAAEIYDAWSKEHFRTVGDKGREGYKGAWAYIKPLADKKMRDIRTDDYQTVIDKMVRDGKSRSLCEKVRQLCSQMGKYAVREDIADRNYADFIHLPKNEKKEKEIFSADEIRRLWEAQNDSAAKIVLILIYTGFRINELFDMKKADVNLADGYMIGGEKTEAGKNRMVPIHPCIWPLVEWWVTEKESEYLISNTAGGRKDAKNFRERDYYPLLDQLEIPRKNPHCTRHTFASLMAAGGAAPEALQKIIGHAQYSTTANIYVHKDLEQLKEAIEKISLGY